MSNLIKVSHTTSSFVVGVVMMYNSSRGTLKDKLIQSIVQALFSERKYSVIKEILDLGINVELTKKYTSGYISSLIKKVSAEDMVTIYRIMKKEISLNILLAYNPKSMEGCVSFMTQEDKDNAFLTIHDDENNIKLMIKYGIIPSPKMFLYKLKYLNKDPLMVAHYIYAGLDGTVSDENGMKWMDYVDENKVYNIIDSFPKKKRAKGVRN